MNRLKIFISYSSKDSFFAGKLKKYFEKYVGFEVFLAHDDIDISEDFVREVWENLLICDFVIPIISKSVKFSSYFANQEIGVAIAKGKKILPICIDDTKPFGFLDHVQGHVCKGINDEIIRNREIFEFVLEVYFLAIRHPQYKKFQIKALDSLSFTLEKSDHFKVTSIIIGLLKQTHFIVRFTKKQIQRIIRGAKQNQQVYTATYLLPKLKDFLQKEYKKTIDL